MQQTRQLVLASTSVYRQALLARLRLDFDCAKPDVDETRHPEESADRLVARLAEAKAEAVAHAHPDALIIGSDQVAEIDREILGKPGSIQRAHDQLRRLSGRTVRFHTGLCLLDARSGQRTVIVEPFDVVMRSLSDEQIAFYVETEQPLDCAGAFKSEGLGIALFERLQGDDPNSLVGLPLIRLTTLLGDYGLPVLGV